MISLSKAFLLLLLVSATVPVGGQSYSPLPVSTVAFAGTRDVPLNVKIIFLGLSASDVNSTYLTEKINVPAIKPQSILAGAQNTGVTYKFNYQINFADNQTVLDLVSFLNSIGLTEVTTPGAGTLRNPYFDNSTTQISSVTNVFYDAVRVEDRLNSAQILGTAPIPGYTLLIADLHNYSVPSFTYEQYQNYTTKCIGSCTRIPVTVHYYNRTVVEPDLGYRWKRHYMTGWGGGERFYYLDVSAGPSHRTEELPIQVALRANNVDPVSSYARYWSTQFLSDYIAGVVYNLFAPDPVYPVNYSAHYNFHLFVFDVRNSTEMAAGPTMTLAVNSTKIQDELQRLVPYANVTVNAKFVNITDYPALSAAVTKATTTIKDPPINGSIVDARLVYDWLSENGEGHISQFINVTQNTEQLDIPAFIFAFTGRYNFGFTFKADVFQEENPSSIYGVALGDLVLISHGQHDFAAGDYPGSDFARETRDPQPGRGIGFTRTITHELGHQLGLPHPFSYDLTEDFTDSVMGYYPNSLGFSQFDRDMLLRAVNDELVIFAEVTLANTTSNLFNAGQISAAKRAISSANQKYSSMQYEAAVADSLDAALSAFSAHQIGGSAIFSSLLVGIVGLVAGVGLGLLVGYSVFRRRPSQGTQYYKCPVCGQPLRWDPAMNRWYCDRCQKHI